MVSSIGDQGSMRGLVGSSLCQVGVLYPCRFSVLDSGAGATFGGGGASPRGRGALGVSQASCRVLCRLLCRLSVGRVLFVEPREGVGAYYYVLVSLRR